MGKGSATTTGVHLFNFSSCRETADPVCHDWQSRSNLGVRFRTRIQRKVCQCRQAQERQTESSCDSEWFKNLSVDPRRHSLCSPASSSCRPPTGLLAPHTRTYTRRRSLLYCGARLVLPKDLPEELDFAQKDLPYQEPPCTTQWRIWMYMTTMNNMNIDRQKTLNHSRTSTKEPNKNYRG
jgi:hypothetical protein